MVGPPALDAKGFAALTGVSRETLARLETYAGLLARWSGRINLVGRNTVGDLWRRHFLDSAQLMAFLPKNARSVIDLGSGGGFPGLVLAIMGVPGVALVEADARKCVFLREAARITEAAVQIRQERIEAVPPGPRDVVTARGCAPLDRLLGLAECFVGPHTRCLFLKGEHAADELAAARAEWTFTAATQRSRSDPRGIVLCLDGVARARVDA
jgi:16S rRNA (guanine527-N7)-methyltransferase